MTVNKQYVFLCIVCGCICLGVLHLYFEQLSTQKVTRRRVNIRRHTNFNPDMPREGFLISMNNESDFEVARELQLAFAIETMHVVLGQVGLESRLPLYNRHVMQTGRTDDLQIGNLNMLGCLESHREVWTRITQTSYVFEHDAISNVDARSIVETLLHDNARSAWSVILLQEPMGFSVNRMILPENPQFSNVGDLTQTCRDCIAYGTRGYIVTKAGAQILLENYNPPVVQVDAYMSLLNAYHANFTLMWTRLQAVDWIQQPSTIQNEWEMQTLNRWMKQKH